MLLAQAGQIDEAARLAGRLGAFEWDDLDTRETHRWILAELQRIGPAGEPVRAAFLKASARTLHEG